MSEQEWAGILVLLVFVVVVWRVIAAKKSTPKKATGTGGVSRGDSRQQRK